MMEFGTYGMGSLSCCDAAPGNARAPATARAVSWTGMEGYGSALALVRDGERAVGIRCQFYPAAIIRLIGRVGNEYCLRVKLFASGIETMPRLPGQLAAGTCARAQGIMLPDRSINSLPLRFAAGSSCGAELT